MKPPSRIDRRVILYALGGGHGHVVRASRLSRALIDAGAEAMVIVPEDKAWVAAAEGVECVPVAKTHNARGLRQLVDAQIRSTGATDLIVDVRARGVLGELVPLPRDVRTTLLLRAWRQDRLGDLSAAIAAYDRVFDVEANLGWLRADGVQPVLPLAVPTLGDRAVDALLVDGGDPTLARFCDRLGARIENAGFSIARAEVTRDSYPVLSQWAPRVVIGAAGYQLTYECALSRVWHLAVPRPRAYDDQLARARTVAEAPHDPPAFEKRVLTRLKSQRVRLAVITGTYAALARRVIRPREDSSVRPRAAR